jgi:hypothetical protein
MEAFYTQKLLQKNHQSDEHFERPFSFMAVKGKLRNQKERKNNESTNSLQKNTNPATPQSWRDIRVSHRRSRAEPLRLR